jgi:DNA-binding response OmpR family regulator
MSDAQRLLVVEDEKNVGLTLVERLKKEGFTVTWATSLVQALAEIDRAEFDMALLDVGLPDGSGFDVAGFLRKKRPSTAIIFLTAFGNPEDRVHGLELGAEDYVVKPFHVKELILRIQNGLKRAQALKATSGAEPDHVRLGKATIYFSRFQAEVDGETVSLTHKEVALIKMLYEHRGKVVSRDEILNHVWSVDEYPTSRTVDNFIMRLRRLIERNSESPEVIVSIRGVGYQLL